MRDAECNDSNPCTSDRCISGQCQNRAAGFCRGPVGQQDGCPFANQMCLVSDSNRCNCFAGGCVSNIQCFTGNICAPGACVRGQCVPAARPGANCGAPGLGWNGTGLCQPGLVCVSCRCLQPIVPTCGNGMADLAIEMCDLSVVAPGPFDLCSPRGQVCNPLTCQCVPPRWEWGPPGGGCGVTGKDPPVCYPEICVKSGAGPDRAGCNGRGQYCLTECTCGSPCLDWRPCHYQKEADCQVDNPVGEGCICVRSGIKIWFQDLCACKESWVPSCDPGVRPNCGGGGAIPQPAEAAACTPNVTVTCDASAGTCGGEISCELQAETHGV